MAAAARSSLAFDGADQVSTVRHSTVTGRLWGLSGVTAWSTCEACLIGAPEAIKNSSFWFMIQLRSAVVRTFTHGRPLQLARCGWRGVQLYSCTACKDRTVWGRFKPLCGVRCTSVYVISLRCTVGEGCSREHRTDLALAIANTGAPVQCSLLYSCV